MTLAGNKIKEKPLFPGDYEGNGGRRSGVRLDRDKRVFVRWNNVDSLTRKFVELSSRRTGGLIGLFSSSAKGSWSGKIGARVGWVQRFGRPDLSCRFGSRRSERRIVKSGEPCPRGRVPGPIHLFGREDQGKHLLRTKGVFSFHRIGQSLERVI